MNKLNISNPIIISSSDSKEKAVETPASELFLKVDKVFYRVNITATLYLKSERDFVRIITKEKKHVVLQSLKYYEDLLPKSQFIRVHKSYTINLHQIDMVFGNIVQYNRHGHSYWQELSRKSDATFEFKFLKLSYKVKTASTKE